MKRMAFFLKKGNKKMSQFYQSQLELQEDHKDKLDKEGYSVGVMKFSHTEEATERKFVTVYIDSWNKTERDNGFYYYGELEKGSMPSIGDYILKVQERDIHLFGRTRCRMDKKIKTEIVGQVTLEMVQEMRKQKEKKKEELLKKSIQENGRLLLYTGTMGKSLWKEDLSFHAVMEKSQASRYPFTVNKEDIRIINMDCGGIVEVEYLDSVEFILE